MEKLTIVLPSILTVPAIKGGAVELLLENFINQNEKKRKYKLTIIAHHIKGIEKHTSQYSYAKFIYIKLPTLFIRVNSLASNVIKMLPSLYTYLIRKEIMKVGNKDILVEGSREVALQLIESLPGYSITLHTHGPFYPIKDDREKKLMEQLKKVITVSEFVENKYSDSNNKLEKVNITSVKNGIECTRFFDENIQETSDQILQEMNLPKNKKIILFKGRMVKEKGIIELIKAFSSIENNNLILLLVGSKNFGENRILKSKYEKELVALINNDERIVHVGYIPYENIPKLNKVAYACVVPSTWEEPAGLVLVEAIASETPSIISDSGGLPEYATGECAHIITRDKNFIDNLRKAIIEIVDNETYYKRLKVNTSKRRDFYNEERYYDELCQMLN